MESTAPVGDTVPRTAVGAVHEIRIVADGERFRFEPANITVATGDILRFVAVDGSGHNVAFDGSGLSSQAQNQLDRNIAGRAEPLASAPVAEAGETITVSFAGMNPGTYPFFCAAHASLGMRGTIEVK
jgi:plastocyanin